MTAAATCLLRSGGRPTSPSVVIKRTGSQELLLLRFSDDTLDRTVQKSWRCWYYSTIVNSANVIGGVSKIAFAQDWENGTRKRRIYLQ